MHSLVLMENAALGCVSQLRVTAETLGWTRPKVVILCGRGNNGGDGLVIARHLGVLGWECHTKVLGPVEMLSPDNRANWEVLQAERRSRPICVSADGLDTCLPECHRELQSADLILDAMLGTGAEGNPREPFCSWIKSANQSSARRVAIDLPTGVCGESGRKWSPAFHADDTYTFVARKPAMLRPDAAQLFGKVTVLPIGLPVALVEEILAWPREAV